MASPPSVPVSPPIPAFCGPKADFLACENDPSFINTSGSGCCPQLDSWVAGVCNLCTHEFSCPNQISHDAFKWGAALAIVVNIGISVGMALQKAAHTRVEERVAASAKISDEAAAAAKKKGFTGENKWWVGFIMQVSGEIGNLIAYGDPNTPASVVASLGCVAVIANVGISSVFLGEGCKNRDGLGVLFIVIGVILIIEFVPRNPKGGTTNLLPCPIVFRNNFSDAACQLPATWPLGDSFSNPVVSGVMACEAAGLLAVGSDYWYFVQPVWLCYLMVMILLFAAFFVALRRHGPRHCASYLILADIAGGFTVCASVTISSFLFKRLLTEGELYAMAEPIFWLCVLILALTLPVQVNFLNKALAEYDASVVVPTHYVIFTLASICAPSVLYQELTFDNTLLKYHSWLLQVGLFLLGIVCTCSGVIIVSSGHGNETDSSPMLGDSGGGSGDGYDEGNAFEMHSPEANGMSGGMGKVITTKRHQSDEDPPPTTRGGDAENGGHAGAIGVGRTSCISGDSGSPAKYPSTNDNSGRESDGIDPGGVETVVEPSQATSSP